MWFTIGIVIYVRLSVFDSYRDTIVIVISKLQSIVKVIVLLSLSSSLHTIVVFSWTAFLLTSQNCTHFVTFTTVFQTFVIL